MDQVFDAHDRDGRRVSHEALPGGDQVRAAEVVAGMLRAVAPPGGAPLVSALRLGGGLPRLARGFKDVVAAICEVAQMLVDPLGLPTLVSALFAHIGERWDGEGEPGRAKGDEIPLPVRIVHVARDAAFLRMLGGWEFAARVVRERAGGAFDPTIAERLADEAEEILGVDADAPAWEQTLIRERTPRLMLEGKAIDRVLAAMVALADTWANGSGTQRDVAPKSPRSRPGTHSGPASAESRGTGIPGAVAKEGQGPAGGSGTVSISARSACASACGRKAAQLPRQPHGGRGHDHPTPAPWFQ